MVSHGSISRTLSSQTKGLIFLSPFSLGDWPGEMRRKGHVLTRGTTNVSHLPISIQLVCVCACAHGGRSTTFICLTRLQRPGKSSCHCVRVMKYGDLHTHTYIHSCRYKVSGVAETCQRCFLAEVKLELFEKVVE